jgi:hypothetical protein
MMQTTITILLLRTRTEKIFSTLQAMKVADALGMEETTLLGGINEGRSKLEEKLGDSLI